MSTIILKKLWLCVILLTFTVYAHAQHKLDEIPLLKVEDYKGKIPENAPFPIYTNSRVYFRIDTVIQKDPHQFQVGIKTKVEMYQPGSFWNTALVPENTVQRMLKHEQGHVYIAYIAANLIEKEMLTFTFTDNWRTEVGQKFHELTQKYGKMDGDYDNETMHSRDLAEQEKWNKKLVNMLK
ncbi:DUF922 domain-containing protein [Mucilaginibacter corticis]|uniref:DUF922 domain-containing protein n=1 Tax=Mucilaginibacter corticis TaxID=2597670 RepID=A0A556MT65_9SPHI|nr:DUF922 domain-containing protein [Mucilaginibacter corticis]TSJ43116.1 DUF922 domain-containing protein [Mucilaginibacter corticis]